MAPWPAENPFETNWEIASRQFLERLAMLPAEKNAHRQYRLPTEAEWEKCLPAGTVTRYYSADDREGLKEYAWIPENSMAHAHPFGQKKSNAWGLFDMHGNIQEWCADHFNPGYYQSSPKDDPLETSEHWSDRVLRGGNAWNSATTPRLVTARAVVAGISNGLVSRGHGRTDGRHSSNHTRINRVRLRVQEASHASPTPRSVSKRKPLLACSI